MTPTRLLSIHPDQAAAARSASTCGTLGARVEFGVKGTRPDRPWAVVAPLTKRGERDG